jgi:hypothetical protein
MKAVIIMATPCPKSLEGGSGGTRRVEEVRERWLLLKIPRCDIDGVGEVK